LKVSVVGAGKFGQYLTGILRNDLRDLYKVHTVYRATPQSSNERSLTDLNEADLQRSGIDALIIASPDTTHSSYINLGISANLHVFTEKPLGLSFGDIDKNLRLSSERNRLIDVGFHRRYAAGYRVLPMACTQSSRRQISFIANDPFPFDKVNDKFGKLLTNSMIHDLDMFMWALSPTKCEIENVIFAPPRIEILLKATLSANLKPVNVCFYFQKETKRYVQSVKLDDEVFCHYEIEPTTGTPWTEIYESAYKEELVQFYNKVQEINAGGSVEKYEQDYDTYRKTMLLVDQLKNEVKSR